MKQHCNKFDKDFENGPYQKVLKKKKQGWQMVEERTKKLSDGTAGGETLGGSPQMTGLQERPGSILLAKQHR